MRRRHMLCHRRTYASSDAALRRADADFILIFLHGISAALPYILLVSIRHADAFIAASRHVAIFSLYYFTRLMLLRCRLTMISPAYLLFAAACHAA